MTEEESKEVEPKTEETEEEMTETVEEPLEEKTEQEEEAPVEVEAKEEEAQVPVEEKEEVRVRAKAHVDEQRKKKAIDAMFAEMVKAEENRLYIHLQKERFQSEGFLWMWGVL